MTFVFPTEQRVLTPQEYAALGYVHIGEPPEITPNSPLPFSFDFPAYRAETKEEALFDIGFGLFKVGTALATGGLGPAVQTTLGYTLSLLS